MLRLLFLSLLLPTLGLAGTIQWTAPTTVTSGTSYTVTALDTPDGTYHGQGTTTVYKNGAFFASGTPAAGASTTDTGNKTVTYTVVGWSGATSTRTVTIYSPNQSPLGCFDSATGSVTLGANLTVTGWAADSDPPAGTPGAPVARVDVLIDGVDRADATLDGDRPDVATAYSRTDYRNSGWTAAVSTAGLTVGTHTVSIVANDSQGASTNLGAKNFTVVAGTPPSTTLTATPWPVLQTRLFTLTASSSDAGSDLTSQTVDYLAPDSTDWVLGSANWAATGYASQWSGSATALHTLVCKFAPPTAGKWRFRARGSDAAGVAGGYIDVEIVVPAVTSESDYDGDGLPDYWEILHGLDPLNAADASADPDGDEYTNLEEFGLGRNPLVKETTNTGFTIYLRTSESTDAGATVNSATWRLKP